MKYKEIILTDFQKYALIGTILGDTYITFDPRPAKQALQKISEVLNEQ